MPRSGLIALALILVVGLVYLTVRPTNQIQQDLAGMPAASGDTVLETETPLDETQLTESVTDPNVVELPVADAPDASADTPEVLTVDGYDQQEVVFMLQESDIGLETRDALINELNQAHDVDDRETLALVLAQVREMLAE